jgi:hypothetical protein
MYVYVIIEAIKFFITENKCPRLVIKYFLINMPYIADDYGSQLDRSLFIYLSTMFPIILNVCPIYSVVALPRRTNDCYL